MECIVKGVIIATINSENLAHLIKDGLEAKLKDQVLEVLVKPILDEFEKNLVDMVRAELSKYTIKDVQQYRDMLKCAEEFNVKISYCEEVKYS